MAYNETEIKLRLNEEEESVAVAGFRCVHSELVCDYNGSCATMSVAPTTLIAATTPPPNATVFWATLLTKNHRKRVVKPLVILMKNCVFT